MAETFLICLLCVQTAACTQKDRSVFDGRGKDFHKQCFRKVRHNAHMINGTELPAATSGASHLMLEKLDATGRQVFIAVPHYHNINTLEEMYYDTAICSL